MRVVHFAEPRRLDHWCAANGHPEAIVGGLLPARPLPAAGRGAGGRRGRRARADRRRRGDAARLRAPRRRRPDRRAEGARRPSRRGDLVQAGPLLVSGGRSLIDGEDREGFSDGRGAVRLRHHGRPAPALRARHRARTSCSRSAATGAARASTAGSTLAELARLMISFGAEEAINLDGGGSATLVHRGHLLNRPYSSRISRRPSPGRSSPRCCSTGHRRLESPPLALLESEEQSGLVAGRGAAFTRKQQLRRWAPEGVEPGATWRRCADKKPGSGLVHSVIRCFSAGPSEEADAAIRCRNPGVRALRRPSARPRRRTRRPPVDGAAPAAGRPLRAPLREASRVHAHPDGPARLVPRRGFGRGLPCRQLRRRQRRGRLRSTGARGGPRVQTVHSLGPDDTSPGVGTGVLPAQRRSSAPSAI